MIINTHDGKEISTRKFDMVVATDLNWGIGKGNELLAKIPEDMKFFRTLTKNSIVIMGRKTSDSLPDKILKGRINIIISRRKLSIPENHFVYRAACVEDALTIVQNLMSMNFITDFQQSVYVIGGGTIYKQFLEKELIRRVFLTTIHNTMDADVYIPNLYDLGFLACPRSDLFGLTGYEDVTKSKDGIHNFTICTLIHHKMI